MSADAPAVRMAHLEGAYEQIDKRLGSLDGRAPSLERKVDEGFAQLCAEIHSTFGWVIGAILANWITLMLAVFLHR